MKVIEQNTQQQEKVKVIKKPTNELEKNSLTDSPKGTHKKNKDAEIKQKQEKKPVRALNGIIFLFLQIT